VTHAIAQEEDDVFGSLGVWVFAQLLLDKVHALLHPEFLCSFFVSNGIGLDIHKFLVIVKVWMHDIFGYLIALKLLGWNWNGEFLMTI
jgi:hypothetical protein